MGRSRGLGQMIQDFCQVPHQGRKTGSFLWRPMGLPADQINGGSRVRHQAAQVLCQTCGGLGIFFRRAGQQKDGRRRILV